MLDENVCQTQYAKYPYEGIIKIETPKNEDNHHRMKVHVKYSNGDKLTTTYARYLLETHLGRKLSDNEEVDHKDSNSMNNDISNLQVLTAAENRLKMYLRLENRVCTGGTKYRNLKCPICGNIFKLEEKTIDTCLKYKNINNGSKTNCVCCSRSCGHYLYLRSMNGEHFPTLDEQTLDKYEAYTGLSSILLECGPHGFYKVVKSLKEICGSEYEIPIYVDLLKLAYSDTSWADVVYYAYWKNAYQGFRSNFGESIQTRYNMMNFIGQYENINPTTYEYIRGEN